MGPDPVRRKVRPMLRAAAVILAALGAVWAWRAGNGLRLASGALVVAAVVNGIRAWGGWLG